MEMQVEETINGVRSYNRMEKEYDIVVAGGGPAGFAAAIRAARCGMKTALIQDRSVLGGNHSSEIRVGISGANHRTWGRFGMETGVVHEFLLRMTYRSHFSGKWDWNNASQTCFEMADNEENLSLYLNTLVEKVNLGNDETIASIEGVQSRSETRYVYHAKYFIDCTGDGTLSYLAGLGWRMGRESSEEFGEIRAPETDDRLTMGATLGFRSRRCSKPVPYTPPKGAINLREWKKEQFPYLGTKWPQWKDKTFGDFWWAEVGGEIDPISEDPEVMRKCRMLTYGLWDYIKNSGDFPDAEDQELGWIGPVPGKRESRRIMGDVILKESDFLDQVHFDDAVGYAGYMLDIHPIYGYKNPNWGNDICPEMYHPGPGDIPLRALFNSKRKNLFFAGRNASATHVGIGTLRVEATCAVTGEAAATAAAFCIENNCLPNEAASSKIKNLQQNLLRNDSSIIGRTLKDSNDLAQEASITASSIRKTDQTDGNKLLELNRYRGLLLPVETDKLDSIKLWLEAEGDTEVTLEAYGCDKPKNYRLKHKLTVSSSRVSGKGWVEFKLDVEPGAGKKLFILLAPAEGVKLRVGPKSACGILGIELQEGNQDIDFETIYQQALIPDFVPSPSQNLYKAENISDGHIRPYCLPHMWSSAQMAKEGEWIELSLDSARQISRLELLFNSNLNEEQMSKVVVSPELARDFKLEFIDEGKVVKEVTETENYLRFRTIDIEPVQCDKVRLTITQTWGHPHAEVYSMRLYS